MESSDSEDEDEFLETAVVSTGVGAAIGAKPLDKAKNKSQVAPAGLPQSKKKVYDFEWPAREMFIWCVLMRRRDIAMLFLEEEKYAIAPALTASIMLRNMASQSYTVDAETIKEIEDMAREFENMAIGVLGDCFAADEFKSKTLLIRVHQSYGGTTLLQLAVEANNRQFVSHQACQNLLNNIWWGKMDELQGEWRLIFSLICPPLLFALIQFRNQEELRERHKMKKKKLKQQKKQAFEAKRRLDLPRMTQTLDERGLKQRSKQVDAEAPEEVEDDDEQELTCWGKIAAFYNAPKITFFMNTGFYIAFLLLFTYMMLSEFHPEKIQTYTVVEIIVAVWVITLLIEEVRQFAVAETNNFYMKVVTYFSNFWNLVDIGTVILFVVGFTIRIVDHEFIITQSTLMTQDKLLKQNIDDHDEFNYLTKNIDTLVKDRHSYSRVVLSIALLAFWCRILHIFSVIRILGPKLVMIGRMIKDLLSFGVILAVFLAAFGIAQHAIMYPNEPADALLIYNVLRRPYWQMYGELFLEDIEGDAECTEDKYCTNLRGYLEEFGVDRTCSNGSSPSDNIGTCADGQPIDCYYSNPVVQGLPSFAFPNDRVVFCYDNSSGISVPDCLHEQARCAEVNRIVPVMLGVYILFTQILMFNLLIAMFSYTFTLVQENTDMHWKFHLYELTKEYYTRPPMPPPFIVLNHLALFFRYLHRKRTNADEFIGDDFKIKLDDQLEKQLAVWERINYEDYSRKKQSQEEASTEFKVSKSKTDLDHLMESADAMSRLPDLYERIHVVEDKLNDTGEALNWIMEALSSNKMGKGKPPLLKITEDEVSRQEVLDAEEKLFLEWTAKKNFLVHVKCRVSPYINTSRIRRFVVANTKVYWEIDWPDYKPVRYTSDNILFGKADYADPDLSKMKATEIQGRFQFNKQDGDICRVSFHGKYQIDTNGLPLNPFGRTGLTGRGDLGRWGPNHALDGIVSRWKRFGDGDLELRYGKKILEFIAVKRADVDEWSLPGVLYESERDWRTLMADQSPESREEVALEAIKEKAFGDCMSEACKATLESIANPRIIFEGYSDDPRNTDNAWVETLAYNFHDDTSEATKELQLRPGARVSKVAWVEAAADLLLFAGHGLIVKKLIDMHGAAD